MDQLDLLTPKESRFDTPVRYVTDVHTSTFIDFHAKIAREVAGGGGRRSKPLETFFFFRVTSVSFSFFSRIYIYTYGKKGSNLFDR